MQFNLYDSFILAFVQVMLTTVLVLSPARLIKVQTKWSGSRIGEVLLRGMRLCEPCDHLESLTRPGVREALIHRGGLRAQILEGGVIRVGDPIALIA